MMPLLIFSGSNDRAIISFCRYASKRGIDFYIVANGSNDNIFISDYKDKVFKVRERNKLTIDDVLNFAGQIKNYSNEVAVLPSTEYINRLLVKNEQILKLNHIYTGLCSEALYQRISDKHSFGEMCRNHNILVPREYTKKPTVYPYVIKPKNYNVGEKILDKPAIICDESDYDIYMESKSDDDYFYQQYIEGRSIYLLYYVGSDGCARVYSQENYVQQSQGGSMLYSESSDHHNSSIGGDYADMFIKVGYRGLLMVEVKKEQDDFFMIEANPRLWGPSQLILDAGMDLFERWAYYLGLIKNF